MGLFSSAVHKFNYDMAPFGGYPLLMLIHSNTPPLIASPVITAPHLPSLPLGGPFVYRHTSARNAGILVPSWNAGKATAWVQPQTTIPSVSNLRGLGVSTITHPPRIQETPRPPLHGLQHQSTIPDVPNRGGYGLSTDTPQPQIPVLRASYGTSGPSLREKQPHLSFPTVFINIYIYY